MLRIAQQFLQSALSHKEGPWGAVAKTNATAEIFNTSVRWMRETYPLRQGILPPIRTNFDTILYPDERQLNRIRSDFLMQRAQYSLTVEIGKGLHLQ